MNSIDLDKHIDAHIKDLHHQSQIVPGVPVPVLGSGERVKKWPATAIPPKQEVMTVRLAVPEWSEIPSEIWSKLPNRKECMIITTMWDKPNGRGKIELIPTQAHLKDIIQKWILAEKRSWNKDVRELIKAWIDEVE